MTDCIFCRIAAGSVPAHEIVRNERLVAFLDISPIRPGHVLIIPCAHHDYFDDIPPDLAGKIVALGQKIAKLQKAMFGVERVGLMFTGTDFAHAHAHVVPMFEKTDITSRRYIQEEHVSFAPLPRAEPEELSQMAERIRAGLG